MIEKHLTAAHGIEKGNALLAGPVNGVWFLLLQAWSLLGLCVGASAAYPHLVDSALFFSVIFHFSIPICLVLSSSVIIIIYLSLFIHFFFFPFKRVSTIVPVEFFI